MAWGKRPLKDDDTTDEVPADLEDTARQAITNQEFSTDLERGERWQSIIAWLGHNGAPVPPIVKYQTEHNAPGGPFTSAVAVFSKHNFDDYETSAALLLRDPSVALIELMHAFNFGDPTRAPIYGYTGIVHGTGITLPPPARPPADPDARPFTSYEFLPGKFADAQNNTYPDGTVWESPAHGRYRKTVRYVGQWYQAWWDKIA